MSEPRTFSPDPLLDAVYVAHLWEPDDRHTRVNVYTFPSCPHPRCVASREWRDHREAEAQSVLAVVGEDPVGLGATASQSATPPASAARDAVVVQEAIAAWMHESRACKWTDFAHSMAHDEDDELRPKLAQAILDALRAAEAR